MTLRRNPIHVFLIAAILCGSTLFGNGAPQKGTCGNINYELKEDGGIRIDLSYEYTETNSGRKREFGFGNDGRIIMSVDVGDSYPDVSVSKIMGYRELLVFPRNILEKPRIETCDQTKNRLIVWNAAGQRSVLNSKTGALLSVGNTEFKVKEITKTYSGSLANDPDLKAPGGGLTISNTLDLIIDSGYRTPTASTPTAFPDGKSTIKDAMKKQCVVINKLLFTPEGWDGRYVSDNYPWYFNPIFNFKKDASFEAFLKKHCPQLTWPEREQSLFEIPSMSPVAPQECAG